MTIYTPKVADAFLRNFPRTQDTADELMKMLATAPGVHEPDDAHRTVTSRIVAYFIDKIATQFVARSDVNALSAQVVSEMLDAEIRDRVVLHRKDFDELVAAMDDFGMNKSHATDSPKLKRVKDAFMKVRQ